MGRCRVPSRNQFESGIFIHGSGKDPALVGRIHERRDDPSSPGIDSPCLPGPLDPYPVPFLKEGSFSCGLHSFVFLSSSACDEARLFLRALLSSHAHGSHTQPERLKRLQASVAPTASLATLSSRCERREPFTGSWTGTFA